MQVSPLGLSGWVYHVAKGYVQHNTARRPSWRCSIVQCGSELTQVNSSVHSSLPVRIATPSCNPYCQEWDEGNPQTTPQHCSAHSCTASVFFSLLARRDQGGELAPLASLWAKVTLSLTKLVFLGWL